MRVGRGIDQLGVDAEVVARSPNAPFEHIAYAQLAADLLRVDPLVPVRERGIARDYEHILEPRQIGRKILGDPVREIALLSVVTEVCKKAGRRSTGVAQARAANLKWWRTRPPWARRLCLQGAMHRPAQAARYS